MSYIFDALKKAEVERNGGTAPDIRLAQTVAPPLPAHPVTRRNALSWFALGALTVIVGGLTWLRFAPAPSATVESKPPMAAVSEPDKEPSHADNANMKESAGSKPAQIRNTKKAAKKNRPLATEAIVTLRELPDSIRQQIPALKVGGYIYSANRADRSVLVNNRLLREGEEIVPGLTLEKMMPNGMVLHFREYRFRVSY